MPAIKALQAREILDSRGNPTIEVDLKTEQGMFRAAVPSGASTGKHEAVELRDGGSRNHGKGVLKAVHQVNTVIAKKVVGLDCRKQQMIDELMITLDGTSNKARLGANAILGVSMAVGRAGAASGHLQLHEYIHTLFQHQAGVKNKTRMMMPIPFCNVINGAKHAGNDLDFQEYMIAPVKAKSFHEAIQMSSETYHTLKKLIEKKHGKTATNVGDEGGFAPPLSEVEEPLQLLQQAIRESGYQGKICLAMDVAASSFFSKGSYMVQKKKINAAALTMMYEDLIKRYPIISIEDPFHEEAFDEFAQLTKKVSVLDNKVQIVGDDLLVTNPVRIQQALQHKSCTALLLKLNQIGTLSEALQAAALSYKHGMQVMVSHRSGETEDSFIADLAVGIGSGQMKSGAPCRSERLAKYNQLLRIEESSKLPYGGKQWLQ